MDEKTKKRWLSPEPIDSKTYQRDIKVVDKVDYLKQRGYVPPDDTELTDDGKVEVVTRAIVKANQRKL